MPESSIRLKSGDKIVFFGDSITQADPGYVSFIADMLGSLYPELNVEVINKGIGGNTVRNLLDRVQDDVIAEGPDWVSVSIGINDCNFGPNGIAPPDFENSLEQLIKLLKARTGATVVLCTPSVIGEDPDGEGNQRLKAYVEAAERVAERHQLLVAPIHDAFIRSLRRAKGSTDKSLFTTDGIHMNSAGNTLFGTTWLKTLGAFEDLLP